MQGLLIYDKNGAERNRWFIQKLTSSSALHGIQLTLVTLENEWEKQLLALPLPDFAVVRVIAPFINEWLERRGVRTFNNFKTAKTACDKWQTYLLCQRLGLPVLPTERLQEGKIPFDGAFPIVIKSVDGHGGNEVFWVQDKTAFCRLSPKWLAERKDYIAQKPCAVLGKDMRAYCMGESVYAAVLRESEGDFRSNFSLGGKVKAAFVDESQKQMISTLQAELNYDYVGIDFLPDGNGGWYVGEIEDAAGARMLYACTNKDIVADFAAYIAKQIAK